MTRIEDLAGLYLRKRNLNYRHQYKIGKLARSDFALLEEKIAIFCDGCFWHGSQSCFSGDYIIIDEVWDSDARQHDEKVTRRLREEG
ncbi:MAG TPA: hypothetical protein VFF30_16805 [Nitrososphaerales archaeon]|nr:hypothetical protein [Nitrososphaerales archaeon]